MRVVVATKMKNWLIFPQILGHFSQNPRKTRNPRKMLIPDGLFRIKVPGKPSLSLNHSYFTYSVYRSPIMTNMTTAMTAVIMWTPAPISELEGWNPRISGWFWLKVVPLPCRMLILTLPGPKPAFCRVRNGRCSIAMRVVVATRDDHGKSKLPRKICEKSSKFPILGLKMAPLYPE